MFRGINHIALDAKGRLALPMRYRQSLIERYAGLLIVTIDTARCLLLYPQAEWEEVEYRLTRLPNLNKQARRLQRLLVGHATECELDGTGRILLPAPLREFASLSKRTVLIGQGNKFELWDEEQWFSLRDDWLAQAADDESLSAELEGLSL